MSGDSRASSYPETWEFEFKRRHSYRLRSASTLYTARLGRNPVEYFGEEIGQSRQLSEDSRVTGKLMPVVALEGLTVCRQILDGLAPNAWGSSERLDNCRQILDGLAT